MSSPIKSESQEAPLLIIDGDCLVYGACQSRFVDSGGFSVIPLDEDGKRQYPEFSKEADRIYLEKSYDNFKKDLGILQATLYSNNFRMAVKGENNFRDAVYSNYKGTRKASPNIEFIQAIRTIAVLEGLAEAADGREADDLVRIWAEECIAENRDFIVCSIDKDLKCIPGKHWLLHHKKLIVVSEEEAKRHYYTQIIQGDPTDSIPGVPGIGKVKAGKMVADCDTDEQYQRAVVGAYFGYYGEDGWYDNMVLNAKLIHIQRHLEDYIDCKDWSIVEELLS